MLLSNSPLQDLHRNRPRTGHKHITTDCEYQMFIGGLLKKLEKPTDFAVVLSTEMKRFIFVHTTGGRLSEANQNSCKAR